MAERKPLAAPSLEPATFRSTIAAVSFACFNCCWARSPTAATLGVDLIIAGEGPKPIRSTCPCSETRRPRNESMTRPAFGCGAIALALLLTCTCMTSAALAALRHDGIVPVQPAIALDAKRVRIAHRQRHTRSVRRGPRSAVYGSSEANRHVQPRPEPAPSYCAGQFQDVSPDGMFRDNIGRIRPCF